MFNEKQSLDGSLLPVGVLLDLDLVDLTPLRPGRRGGEEERADKCIMIYIRAYTVTKKESPSCLTPASMFILLQALIQ